MTEQERTRLESLSPAVGQWLNDVCHRFETAWREGQQPRLEEYLSDAPEPGRSALLRELVLLDIAYRRQDGQAVRTDDYHAYFPEGLPRWLLRELTLGEQAGRYLLQGELGRGGMGIVYRAQDPDLDRELAVKVLHEHYRDYPAAHDRFLREAHITARLQHPHIAPVHEQGRLPDGRPFFAMKLIRGRTLDLVLIARPSPAQDLPWLLQVFEGVCQAVAYAHEQEVIHRDLKPANVMVGAFGEVQVMDWGLAKVLTDGNPEEGTRVATTGEVENDEDGSPVTTPGDPGKRTAPGAVMGTYAYMPPEQARGEVALVDRRSDVFSLGSLLCEILTGQPPYTGAAGESVRRQAEAADLAAAWARLEGCGADVELAQLTKACLAVDREARPANAGEVAEAVATYQTGVQKRLRQAELERAAAQVKAREARKQRRLLVALAGAVLLLVVASGGVVWWRERQRVVNETAIARALGEARFLWEEARANPLGDLGRYHKAATAADKAVDLARQGPVSEAMRQQAEELREAVNEDADAAKKDQQLLVRLLDVYGPRETPSYQQTDDGHLLRADPLDPDAVFAEAFRAWGLNLDSLPPDEAAARLQTRPNTVVTEVVAALDERAYERRRRGQPEAAWGKLLALAEALDTDEARRELRALLFSGRLEQERGKGQVLQAVRMIAAFGSPDGGALLATGGLLEPEPGSGSVHARLRTQARRDETPRDPVLGVLLLVQGLRAGGDEGEALRLLRAAVQVRPEEVVLLYTLGQFVEQGPQATAAIEYYQAARAVRPALGTRLATVLSRVGRTEEAATVILDLLRRQPENSALYLDLGNIHLESEPEKAAAAYRKALQLYPRYEKAYNNLGSAYYRQGRWDEAIATYRQVLAIAPTYAVAQANLALALSTNRQTDAAIAAYERAIELDPNSSRVRNGFGVALERQSRTEEALASNHRAVALDPGNAYAHNNLGSLLYLQGATDKALAAYRRSLVLDPNNAPAHYNWALALERKGQLEEAIIAYRRAVELNPRYTRALHDLSAALYSAGRVDEAITASRRTIELVPGFARAHNNLALALHAKGQMEEAIAVYRHAISLFPTYARAHYNLGLALQDQGQVNEAIAAYGQAIHQEPRYARAYRALGRALLQQGRLTEARAATLRCLEFLSSQDPLRGPATQQRERCDRLLTLEAQLPSLLKGTSQPKDGEESLRLAEICQFPNKRLYVAATRFYVGAFTVKPEAADDPQRQLQYTAARMAALAAAGQGEDAVGLTEKERADLRQQGLHWLRADLTVWRRLAAYTVTHADLHTTLRRWRKDPDLSNVRDEAALQRLAPGERLEWQKLWSDADRLLNVVSVAGGASAPALPCNP